MAGFAERTGLTSERPQRRYLWTDAFAVCNFLGLARATAEERYRELALRLVDRVHHTLGRHRPDDGRQGWLSGLDDRLGEEHPTLGGLRIGKELPERRPRDPFDERLEWDRDGQYFHYLTRWMHALDVVARTTGEARFNRWARELAAAAHDAFTYDPPDGSTPRMVWKMSIDLSRPLVPSMGLHDPLEGLVAVLELDTTAAALHGDAGSDLHRAAARFAAMIEGRELATTDPLGLGGLLLDAHCLDRLLREGGAARTGAGAPPVHHRDGLLGVDAMHALWLRLLEAALSGLAGYVREAELETTAAALHGDAGSDLHRAAARFAVMIEGRELATTDPLGLGGLLMDAHRLDRLRREGGAAPTGAGASPVHQRDGLLGADAMRELRLRLLEAALSGLAGYVREAELERPAAMRLGFRELGLAIGLAAVDRMAQAPAPRSEGPPARAGATEHSRETAVLERLARFVPLGDRIETFWLAPEHRAAATWQEHLDINEVMLATRLEPGGCLY